MGPGPMIAINVVLLYTILGPLVLLGIYVLFDSLDRSGSQGKQQKNGATDNKNPALWTSEKASEFVHDASGLDEFGVNGPVGRI